jgi:hypothetical protein
MWKMLGLASTSLTTEHHQWLDPGDARRSQNMTSQKGKKGKKENIK